MLVNKSQGTQNLYGIRVMREQDARNNTVNFSKNTACLHNDN